MGIVVISSQRVFGTVTSRDIREFVSVGPCGGLVPGEAQGLALTAGFDDDLIREQINRGRCVKTLRTWRRICVSNRSSLRAITLCQDAEGLWVGFTETSPEGPDQIVYLPATLILPMADALDSVAEREDRTYHLVPCPIEGKDHRGRPARLNVAACTMVAFRYRPVIVFNGPQGIWSAQFVSGRHAGLVARLLRRLHERYEGCLHLTKGRILTSEEPSIRWPEADMALPTTPCPRVMSTRPLVEAN